MTNKIKYEMQSGNNNTTANSAKIEESGGDGVQEIVSETVNFLESKKSLLSDTTIAPDRTKMAGYTDSLHLGDFLSRDIRIKSFTWVGGTTLTEIFSPWYDLLTNPSVSDKIRNFGLFRANLKLRIVINGSPFMYGRAIVSVIPFLVNNLGYQRNLLATGSGSTTRSNLNNWMSQAQHNYLDPSSNNTVEIVVPFLLPKNWATIMDTVSNNVKIGEFTDVNALPSIAISEINPLRIGNTATAEPRVNISVFAHFDDVEISVPTASKFSLEGPEEENDTAKKVPIVSTIASALSTGFSMVSAIPMISPFATAASLASGAVADIAKLFGWSRPINLADTQRFYPEIFSNPSSTQGGYTGYKMTVDPHQGLSIDPRISSVEPRDDLVITNIAERECYLTTIPWDSTNQTTGNACLFQIAVNPYLFSVDIADGGFDNVVVQPTPCSFAVTPFKYWKGTMKYKLQMVASQYHRGRIAVVYEPNTAILAGNTTPVNFNSHLTTILDIEDVDGHEISIPWYADKPMLEVPPVEVVSANYYPVAEHTSIGPVGYGNAYSNGVLRIYVINELTAATVPVPQVEINVFVSCLDLEVGFPRNIKYSDFTAEGPDIEGFNTNEMSVDDLMGDNHKFSGNQMVVIGERVLSFRSLLKRFNNEHIYERPDISSVTISTSLYPRNRMLSPDVPQPTEPDNISMFNYLRLSYLSMRGGMRRMVRIAGSHDSGYYTVSNRENNIFAPPQVTAGSIAFHETTMAGTVTNPVLQNNGVTWETPCYMNNRYLPSQANNGQILISGTTGDTVDSQITGTLVNYTSHDNEAAHSGAVIIDSAVAEDFNFSGYIACPPRVTTFTSS